MDIKDLASLGTAFTKLIETISAGTGRTADGISRIANVYWLANKDAQNEAQRILLVESAKTQAVADRVKTLAALSKGGNQYLKTLTVTGEETYASFTAVPSETLALQARSTNRMAYQNALRQLNLEAIEAEAAAELLEENHVSDEPVDQDWINRFLRYGEDVSSENLQALWGKILAGEVKQPGAFSVRTLDVLRNLAQEEAAAFTTLCQFVIEIRYESGIDKFIYKGGLPFTPTFMWQRIGYTNILRLMECGLLQTDEKATYSLEFGLNQEVNAPFKMGDKVLSVKGFNIRKGPLIFPVYNLTQAGKQLAPLIKAQTPLDYVADFAKPFQAFDLQGKYGNFIAWNEDGSIKSVEELHDLPLT